MTSPIQSSQAGRPVSHLAALVALTGACALWGTSFASIKICGVILVAGAGDVSPAFGPVLFTALRFTLAALLVFALWPASRAPLAFADWGPLLKVSFPMAAGFLFQGAGLAFTTATTSGFITGLCVCLTPLLEWVAFRRRPSGRLAVAVAMAFVGTAMLTGGGRFAFSLGAGEILTLLSVLAYSFQILYTGQVADRIGPAPLTAWSFLLVALCAWASSLAIAPAAIAPALAAAFESGRFWAFFLITLAFATLGASILMNLFQRHVRPTEAAVVYTTEPVFAGLFAILWIGWSEFPGFLGSIGAALMIAANLLVAVQSRPRTT